MSLADSQGVGFGAAQPVEAPPPQQNLDGTIPSSVVATPGRQKSATNSINDHIDRRVAYIEKSNPWLPVQAKMQFATSGISDQAMAGAIEALRQTVAKANDGFAYFAADPVLEKNPSLALGLKTYINQVAGPLPIGDADLTHIQTRLQKQGFGQDLPVDGTWSGAWNAAFNQYGQRVITEQFAGKKALSLTPGSALHVLGSVLPKEALNATIGFISSLPHNARQVLADLAMTVATPAGIANQALGGQGEARFADTAGGFVMGQTPEQFASHVFGQEIKFKDGRIVKTDTLDIGKAVHHAALRSFEDVSNLMLVAGLLKAGSSIALASGEDLAKGISMEEAKRGPGVVANMVGKRAADSYVFNNLPVLGRVGPWVANAAEDGSWYFKARTLARIPYALPATRIAGNTLGTVGLFGAAARGVGALDPALGGDQGKKITDAHYLDGVDQAIRNRLDFTPLGVHVQLGLDDLAFLLHPTTHLPSTQVGASAEHLVSSLDDALGRSSILSEIQRGVQMASEGKAPSAEELAAHFDRADHFSRFWTEKTLKHAAAFYAEREIGKLADPPAMFSTAWIDSMREFENIAWQSRGEPDGPLAVSLKQMLADPGNLASRVAKDITNSNLDPAKFLSQNGSSYMKAWDELRGIGRSALDTSDQSGMRLFRRHEPGTDWLPSTRPQGTYFNIIHDPSKFVSYHMADEEIGALSRLGPDAVLDVSDMPGMDSAGIAAGRRLLGDAWEPLARLSNDELLAKLKVDFPGRNWDELYGTESAHGSLAGATGARSVQDIHHQTLLEAYAGEEARKQGFKAIIQREADPASNAHEFVALTDDAIKVVKQQEIPDSFDHVRVGKHRPFSPVPDEAGPELAAAWDEFFATGAPIDHLAHLDGTQVGLALNTSVDQAEALNKAENFKTRLQMGEDELAVRKDVGEALFRDFGIDDLRQPQVSTRDKIDTYINAAHRLAQRAYPLRDAPPEVRDAIARIGELGYKPVLGNDIGWLGLDLPKLDMGAELTTRRKIAGIIGLNTQRFDNVAPGTARRLGIRNEIQSLVDSGKLSLPPRWTADTVLAYLQHEDVLQMEPGLGERVAISATAPLRGEKIGQTADALRGDLSLSRESDLRAVAKARVENAFNIPLQLRDAPERAFVHALTDPAKFEQLSPEAQMEMAANGEPWYSTAPFSAPDAKAIYRAVLRGSAAPKNYMLGLSRMEDLFRASGTFAGEKLPFSLGKLETLPNDLIRLRNKFRFELSPEFSWRRLAKTNYKVMLDGVTPTLNAGAAMREAGTFEDDMKLLDRVMPDPHSQILDDADRYLRENDIFSPYNHREFQAYAAGQWARQGKSTDEIRNLLIKDFSYGTTTGQAGRTAAERSANFMFFPLSFDKTLYRNSAAYLLDRPAQLILVTAGLRAYKEFNDTHLDGNNPLAWSWMEKHLPVLQEAVRFNAFAHGINAGEFGGINAPIINMFLPQSWQTSKGSLATLNRFVPALKDFNRMLKESKEQFSIGHTAAVNTLADLSGKTFPKAPYLGELRPVAESKEAQMQDAFNAYREMLTDPTILAYVRYNDQHSSGKRAPFPNDPQVWGDMADEAVTKTNLRELVHKKYPVFNAADGVAYAASSQQALNRWLRSIKGTDNYEPYKTLFDAATKAGTAIFDDRVPLAQAASATNLVRLYATQYAQQDPDFYAQYKAHLQRLFGPLERVDQ